jgi:phosphoglucosamine mutase
MSEKKFFGTDGIRGKVGTYPMTPDLILKLGWAAGKVLAAHGEKRVIIGKDTRISGYMFESALEAGFAAAGIKVFLIGPMPTPAVAYLTRAFRADAGIVISASHNPHYDNGIKFFGPDGKKLSDKLELEIESYLKKDIELVDSEELGKAYRIEDAAGRYIEFCKSTIPLGTNLNGLKLVVDCANGAAYHIAEYLFKELGADVSVIGNKPNGYNINEACGATNVTALAKEVVKKGANIGIALDGDADRVIFVDHKGETVDGDVLLYILLKAKMMKREVEGVVGTVMSNLGLEKAIKRLGVGFERSKVGDRYVMEKLTETGWEIGGESSGHLICLDCNTTGDGLVSALQVIHFLHETHTVLHEIKKEVCLCPQVLKNIHIKSDADAILNTESFIKKQSEAEKKLSSTGRILIRKSGTEPLIRVMVEGEDSKLVESIASELEEHVVTLSK